MSHETKEEKKARLAKEKAEHEAKGTIPPPDLSAASESPPEGGAPEGVEASTLSYPPPLKEHPDNQHKVRRWKEEGRIPCAHSRNRKGGSCYYPLNLIRTNKTGMQPEKITLPDGAVAYRAECSWDPQHRGPDGEEQYITHAERFPTPADE